MVEKWYTHLGRQLQRFNRYDPFERCGLVMWNIRRCEYWLIEMDNIHPTPTHHFAISRTATARTLLRHWDRHDKHVGYLHTHPGQEREDTSPSAHDLQTAARLRSYTHMVYHPYTRRLTVYNEAGPLERLRIKPKWRAA